MYRFVQPGALQTYGFWGRGELIARLSIADVLTWVSVTEVAESWEPKVSGFKNTFGNAQTPVGHCPYY